MPIVKTISTAHDFRLVRVHFYPGPLIYLQNLTPISLAIQSFTSTYTITNVMLTSFMFIPQCHQARYDAGTMSRVSNPQLFNVRLAEIHKLFHAKELWKAFCEGKLNGKISSEKSGVFMCWNVWFVEGIHFVRWTEFLIVSFQKNYVRKNGMRKIWICLPEYWGSSSISSQESMSKWGCCGITIIGDILFLFKLAKRKLHAIPGMNKNKINIILLLFSLSAWLNYS